MPQVIVQQVLQGPVKENPFPSHGKVIEPVAWLVNALVDGQAVQNIKLRAFSAKVLWIVFAGSTVVCDPPKMHNNQIEYKITTPSEANGHVNEQQGQAPVQQPMQQPSLMPPVVNQTPPAWAQPILAPIQNKQVAPQRPTYIQPPSYTREEYEDLLIQGVKFARDTFDKKTDPAVIASFAATYVIGATKLGIKISTTKTAKAGQSPDLELMWNIVFDRGLGERVKNANLLEPTLTTWFEQAGKDANAFVIRLNYELKQIESGKSDDNIPL